MSKHLISTVETYRVDTEAEAAELIEEAKKSHKFTLAKYSSVYKERKQKGEVADAWHRVSLTKIFDDEKDPIGYVSIDYDTEGSAF